MSKAHPGVLEVIDTSQQEDAVSEEELVTWLIGRESRPTDPRVAAFNVLPTPAMVIDGHASIVACNAAASAVFGIPPDALIGRCCWDLIAGDNSPENSQEGKLTLQTPVGAKTIILEQVPVTGNEGRALTLFLLQVERRHRRKTDVETNPLILDVAHELRSPLQSFNLALSGLAVAAKELSDADQKRLVGALQRSSVHLQTLVENLLDAASLGGSQYSLIVDTIDISTVIREATLIVDPLLQPNKQRIRAMLPEAPLHVQGDAQRLRQVLVNLLHNAVKYGPRDETIVVRARRQQGEILVTVTDRGPGIPEEEQAQIFERYYRGRAASSIGHGNGLGLAIARATILAHGGSIGVHNEPRHGTTFWFTLRATR
jgi:signal transduction histidine kinase